MSTIILGLFNNSEHAIKQDVTEGATAGGTAGAVAGALMGIFSGITSVVIPGIGLVVGGPLVALLGLTGGAIGSLTGGLVGALVDLGINEPTAKMFDERIRKGEILVGVSTEEDEDTVQEVKAILSDHGATDISTFAPGNNSM